MAPVCLDVVQNPALDLDELEHVSLVGLLCLAPTLALDPPGFGFLGHAASCFRTDSPLPIPSAACRKGFATVASLAKFVLVDGPPASFRSKRSLWARHSESP